jgi:hypothetical protein
MHSHDVGVVDFPTLGDLWSAWMERHCRVPDRHERGKPFREYDWQFWCTANHGRIRPEASYDPDQPPLNQAFEVRRSQVVGPQKIGKGPWTAARICNAAVGPSEFAGWARAGDLYRCADHGCGCGWEFAYNAGEPMGRRHPSPLIQIMATSDDQVANIWRPLVSMIALGPLKELLLPRGEFIRIVGESGDRDMDRIDRVTASAKSRLGAPLNEAFFDESGLYTESNKLLEVYDTMRRGAAGMGGRSMETTNAWDPSEKSAAQLTQESNRPDIFRFWRDPDRAEKLKKADGKRLSFGNRAERRRILRYVYEGAGHINIDSIEAEALELMERDPAQAERFFGNRVVAGLGTWCDGEAWDARAVATGHPTGKRPQVVLGFDGSDVDDWTGIRAETRDGYQFTPVTSAGPTIWNPAKYDGKVPRLDVSAAVDELFEKYDVLRMYCDPPYWETEIDGWAEKHGDRVYRWETFRPKQMWEAAERLLVDVGKKDSGFTHDGCQVTAQHVRNARKAARQTSRYILTKPGDGRKIDMAVVSVLCHEAWGDATAAKEWRRRYRAYSA